MILSVDKPCYSQGIAFFCHNASRSQIRISHRYIRTLLKNEPPPHILRAVHFKEILDPTDAVIHSRKRKVCDIVPVRK